MTGSRSLYKQFTDERTGRSYYYITTLWDTSNKVNSVTVMAENLNIGEMRLMDLMISLMIPRLNGYCYDNDTTYCDEYGGSHSGLK